MLINGAGAIRYPQAKKQKQKTNLDLILTSDVILI